MKVLNNVTELIGSTPMVRLTRIAKDLHAEILVKLEYLCPVGGIKGRVALAMIEAAERDGRLVPGMTVLEATSGTTGRALAIICRQKGYPCVLVMPESMSDERKQALRAHGAELVLTPKDHGMNGSLCKTEEIATSAPGHYFVPRQFDNPVNALAQRNTGDEIWQDTDGRCDIFVAGVGTGGTITGVGEAIRARKPDFRVIAVEPAVVAVLTGTHCSRCGYVSHPMQGIGAGFIPGVLNREIYDEVVTVEDGAAMEMARRLAKEEGIFAGTSTGANVWAALQVARRPESRGKLIVTVACSSGDMELSTPTYARYATQPAVPNTSEESTENSNRGQLDHVTRAKQEQRAQQKQQKQREEKGGGDGAVNAAHADGGGHPADSGAT